MSFRNVLLLLVAAATISYGSAQTTNLPVLNITQGQPLPVLQEMQPDSDGWITLNMLPAGIQVTHSCWAAVSRLNVQGGERSLEHAGTR